MLVTMIETRLISEDGYDLQRCKSGETYDLAHEAACLAIRKGWAVKVQEKTIVDYRMGLEKAQGLLNIITSLGWSEQDIQRQKEEVFFARIELEQAERAWA